MGNNTIRILANSADQVNYKEYIKCVCVCFYKQVCTSLYIFLLLLFLLSLRNKNTQTRRISIREFTSQVHKMDNPSQPRPGTRNSIQLSYMANNDLLGVCISTLLRSGARARNTNQKGQWEHGHHNYQARIPH